MADLNRSGGQSQSWIGKLRVLSEQSASAPAHHQRRIVNDLTKLLAAQPTWDVAVDLPKPDQARVSRLLDVDAFETAALVLLPPNAGYLASRGPDDDHLATLLLAGSDKEWTAEGNSLALALSGALANAVVGEAFAAVPASNDQILRLIT